MDYENKDNYIFIIGGTNDVSSISNDLIISDVFDVRDRSQKRLVLSKLLINNKKMLIESNFLRVVAIDSNKNKVILELDSESDKVFRLLDNKVIELLGDLLSENNEKMDGVELNIDGELTYVPIVSDENKMSNTFRLCLDSKTTLKYNKNSIELNQVKVGDMFRFLIEIESINLYPNELLCHIRPYCHMGEIYRTNTYKLSKRIPIKNYTFSTDVENVFQKVVLDDQDISLIKTEIEPENDSENDSENDNMNISLKKMDNISEESEKLEESEESEKSEHSDSLHLKVINNTYDKENVVIGISETSEINDEQDLNNEMEDVKPKRKYTKKNNDNKQILSNVKKTVNSRKKKTL
jgi:hypothetical protein